MESFMIALLECSVSMTAISIFYMAATPFLQNHFTAKGRYYAWLAVTIGFIIPFRFHSPMSVVSVKALFPPLENAGRFSFHLADSSATASAAALPWHIMASGFWIAGVIVFLTCHAIRHRRLLRMIKRWSMECSDQQTLLLLQDVQANMNITRQVDLRICPGVISPMLVGFVRPIILLPSDNIPANELLFILKHELIHLKRGDLGYKILVFAATAMHWFNPLVYRMTREIALQCEISCDEEVIKHSDTSNRQQYVEAIIGVMKKHTRRGSAFSTSFSDSRQNMKNRVLSIMDTRSKKWGISLSAIIVLATIGTGAVLQLNPVKAETAAPGSTQPIVVPSLDNAGGKQDGTALEPLVSERDTSVPDGSMLLIPVSAPEQKPSDSLSSEAERVDGTPTFMFADPGISR